MEAKAFEGLKELESKYGKDALSAAIKFYKSDNVIDEYRENWNLYCMNYGLTADDYGKMFFVRGTKYIAMGIKPNNRKYPIIAKHGKTGTMYKFDVMTFKATKQEAKQ